MTSVFEAYLAEGDGATPNSISLFQEGVLLLTGLDVSRLREGIVTASLDILGADHDAVGDTIAAIERKLDLAEQRTADLDGTGRVILSLRLGTTDWVSIDILSGVLRIDDAALRAFETGWIQGAVLELDVLPRERGQPITSDETALLSLGTPALVSDVPGRGRCSYRLKVRDKSAGTVKLGRLYLGNVRRRGVTTGDFDHVVDVTPSGAGSTQSDGTAWGGSYARTVASTDWQQVAHVTKSSAGAGALTEGLLDVFGRVRDASPALDHPLGMTLSSSQIQLVQYKVAPGPGGTYTSLAATLDAPTTAGNLLVLTVYGNGTSPPVNTPTGWTAIPGASTNDGTRYMKAFEYVNAPSISGSFAVTASSKHQYAWILAEYSGITTTSPRDIVDIATGTNDNPTLTTSPTSTAQASEVAMLFYGNGLGALDAADFSNGFVAHDQTALPNMMLADKILTATGVVSTTVTATNTYIGLILTYKGVLSAGGLAAGDYTIRVASVDGSGNVSVASPAQTVTLEATGGIQVTWGAPLTGTPAQYRIYYSYAGSEYRYIDTGSMATSYLFSTDSGTVGDPILGSSLNGQFRLRVGLESGTVTIPVAEVESKLANSAWETLYLGTIQLPPVPAIDGVGREGWYIGVDVRHPVLTSTMDVDCLVLMPHGVMIVEYRDADGVAANVPERLDWTIDVTRDGAVSAVVSTPNNAIPNGGFETNTTGWGSAAGVTIARSTDQARFGAASLKSIYASGPDYNFAAVPLTLTEAAYEASIWLYIPANWNGGAITFGPELYSGAATTTGAANMALTDQWQEVTCTCTPVAGDLTGFFVVRAASAPSVGRFIYLDGALVTDGSSSEQGHAVVDGRLPFGAGDNLILPWADGALGANNVSGTRLTLEFERITPSFFILPGSA